MSLFLTCEWPNGESVDWCSGNSLELIFHRWFFRKQRKRFDRHNGCHRDSNVIHVAYRSARPCSPTPSSGPRLNCFIFGKHASPPTPLAHTGHRETGRSKRGWLSQRWRGFVGTPVSYSRTAVSRRDDTFTATPFTLTSPSLSPVCAESICRTGNADLGISLGWCSGLALARSPLMLGGHAAIHLTQCLRCPFM